MSQSASLESAGRGGCSPLDLLQISQQTRTVAARLGMQYLAAGSPSEVIRVVNPLSMAQLPENPSEETEGAAQISAREAGAME